MTKKGIIQLIFFLFFLVLLISATDPLQTILPVDLFFRDKQEKSWDGAEMRIPRTLAFTSLYRGILLLLFGLSLTGFPAIHAP